MRDSFLVFRNQVDSIRHLPTEQQAEAYNALADYNMVGELPQGLSPAVRALMQSFKLSVEKSIANHIASVENGRKGGIANSKRGEAESEQEQAGDEPTQADTEQPQAEVRSKKLEVQSMKEQRNNYF